MMIVLISWAAFSILGCLAFLTAATRPLPTFDQTTVPEPSAK
jgi:hypothetical protein